MADTFVCNSVGAGTQWFYDSDHEKFIQKDANGAVISKISGKYLPEPSVLWNNRCTLAGVTTNSDVGQRLRPAEATFALAAYWKAIKDSQAEIPNADNNA